MKYIVVLGDGMADYPVAELGGKTPLQAANKPQIDALAKKGILGLVKTIPDGMVPGSDTANLAVLGYDPRKYYSGRSPFEAASMGVVLAEEDVAFRCNLVTLSEGESYGDKIMVDHSADEISTEEAGILLGEVSRCLSTQDIRFYPGVSYRHLMVWRGAPLDWRLTPPHDILGKAVGDHLPGGTSAGIINELLIESAHILPRHPLNLARVARGLRPANAIWLWGEGKKAQLVSFNHKYGLKGAVISAVDLLKGIGVCAGMKLIHVAGSTGNLDTDFRAEAEAALAALQDGIDFVYLHIEAPDECAHRQETENKVKSIELIDSLTVKTLKAGLDRLGEPYRLMILPDHATPLSLRTHTADPVPFLIYDSQHEQDGISHGFDEQSAKDSGFYLGEGYRLMDLFLRKTEGK